jgi:hypothetical protein
MEIEFRRTGERRYAVVIGRGDGSILEMSPAPGFDPLMPHDLLHYVVESELGLRSGIFGQIAKGGGAGTFRVIPTMTQGRRDAARRRRRLAKRGARLFREGRGDSSMSERAVCICHREWLTRRADAVRRQLNDGRFSAARANRAPRATQSNDVISDEQLNRICARLERLSGRWARLGIGESVTVEWPEGRRSAARSNNT